MKRYSRAEAAAMLMDVLKDIPCPARYGYGGWSAVLGDFACLANQTVKNIVHDGRQKKYSTSTDCQSTRLS